MGNCFTKPPAEPASADPDAAEPNGASADAPIQNPPAIPGTGIAPAKSAAPIGPVLGHPMEDVCATYSLGKELGRGQFGVIYLCTHKATDDKLACKTIPQQKLTNEEDIEDVRREVQIMYHLSGQHNIVELKGADTAHLPGYHVAPKSGS